MKEKGFWEGVQAAVPTALGYVSIGLACGIIGSPYVTPVEMGLMSLFVYAGSAQFAMIALIAVQAPVAAIAMTVVLPSLFTIALVTIATSFGTLAVSFVLLLFLLVAFTMLLNIRENI